jgi:hypothetical protein
MKTLKPWMFNVVTLVVVGLLFVAQGVGAGPGAEPAAPLAPAQTLISYQGTLTDPGGHPVNGTATMEFALYDAASSGNRLWGPEMQSVEVSDGLFHALLGSVEGIDPLSLTGDLYLDITVNGEEMSPRERLASSAYAMATQGGLNMNGHHLWNVDDIIAGNPDGGGWEAQNLLITNDLGNIRLRATGSFFFFIDTDNNETSAVFRILRDAPALVSPAAEIFQVAETGEIDAHGTLDMNSNAIGEIGKISLNSGKEIFWSDNGQIRSYDNNHRIVFDRSHNELELREYGTIGFYAGGSSGGDADLVVRDSQIDVKGNSVVNCGALTEANLQSEEELAAERIDRFEEGDVLCWAGEQLEKCAVANDRLVQAVANEEGRPIIIGAEAVKVLGPVHYGDLLVASDVPGYAMVNNDPRAGAVIAQALEGFDGEQGIIKAMIRKF